MRVKILLLSLTFMSLQSLADIIVNKNSIVCEKESGILAVAAMKELKKYVIYRRVVVCLSLNVRATSKA